MKKNGVSKEFQSQSADGILFAALHAQVVGRELICRKWRKPRVVKSVEFEESADADYAIRFTATTGEVVVMKMWETFKVKYVEKKNLTVFS